MNILVFNAGSSSLKFRLFQMDSLRLLSETETVLAHGQINRIGKPDAQMTFAAGSEANPEQGIAGIASVSDAAAETLRRLVKPRSGGAGLAIDAVGHRIVHGGDQFFEPVRVDQAVLADIRDLTELAPLHNPAGMAGIEAAMQALPGIANVVVFDTAFHHHLPPVSANYALPLELRDRLKLRRYGFHGISYRYVSERLIVAGGRTGATTRVVICHLGNGASICALRDGKSVDTSMGFTPMEGLVMGTRSGDIDPGLVLHLLRHEKMTLDQMDELLNHRSGLLGLSGTSGDVRDLEQAADSGNQPAELALECFAYRVRKYVGAYAAALGGVDVLVFTGGIGEHSPSMRARICRGLDFLDLRLDEQLNQQAAGREPSAIGISGGRDVWVVPTDEERQIAREAFTLLQ